MAHALTSDVRPRRAFGPRETQEAFEDLYIFLSASAAGRYRTVSRRRTAAQLDGEVAELLMQRGDHRQAADAFALQCAVYDREGWPHLLAQQLPRLAQCQRRCDSPALPATCLAILGLPSGALPPAARASAGHLLTSVLKTLPPITRTDSPMKPQPPSDRSQPGHDDPPRSPKLVEGSCAATTDATAEEATINTTPVDETVQEVDLSKLLLLRPTDAASSSGAAHGTQGDAAQLELVIVSRFPHTVTLQRCTLTLDVSPGTDNPHGARVPPVTAHPVTCAEDVAGEALAPAAPECERSLDPEEVKSHNAGRVDGVAPSSTTVADTAKDIVAGDAPQQGHWTAVVAIKAEDNPQEDRRPYTGCIRLQPGQNRVVFEAVLTQHGVYRLRSLRGRLMGVLPSVTRAVEGAATAGGEAWGWLGGAWAAGKGTGWGCIAPRAVLRVTAPRHRMQVNAS